MIITSSKIPFYFLFSISFFIASFSSASDILSSSSTTTTITPAWDSFLNLSSCRVGDQNPALPLLKTYLRRFGYLTHTTAKNDATFDSDLESAIKIYQDNFQLDPTGLLDLPTIFQLISPRCGVPDFINGTSFMSSSSSGRHLYAYFPLNPKWPTSKRHLTYAITSTSAVSIPTSVLRPVFARAFARWSGVTKLTFKEVRSSSDADVTIGFYRGDHGDGEAFDGPLGTLAHAFSPTDGRFHLDADEAWVVKGDVSKARSENAVDLESVVVHEIGHLLGLGHSAVKEAVMFPTLRTRTRKVELVKDDVEGVQSLYGRNPSYKVGVEGNRDTNGGGGGTLMVRGAMEWARNLMWGVLLIVL